jgi:ketosteroid isomerase-like protein
MRRFLFLFQDSRRPEMQELSEPRALFERQIEAALSDDRRAQLDLLAEDCVWEFPFTPGGRPRRTIGRSEIERVMMPGWQRAREAGIRGARISEVIHETSDPNMIVAEFEIRLEVAATGRAHQVPFVQVLRARDGKIAELREYFDPGALQRLFEPEAA